MALPLRAPDNPTGTATTVLHWASSLVATPLISPQSLAGVFDFGKFQHSLPSCPIARLSQNALVRIGKRVAWDFILRPSELFLLLAPAHRSERPFGKVS
jgi:hypothetical protein